MPGGGGGIGRGGIDIPPGIGGRGPDCCCWFESWLLDPGGPIIGGGGGRDMGIPVSQLPRFII